jgi:hypothetical protein
MVLLLTDMRVGQMAAVRVWCSMAKSPPKTGRRPVGGRPSRADRDEPERMIVSVSVETDLVRRFDIAAKREARTRSSQIALLMRQWVEGSKL